jgi:hypothetical protein
MRPTLVTSTAPAPHSPVPSHINSNNTSCSLHVIGVAHVTLLVCVAESWCQAYKRVTMWRQYISALSFIQKRQLQCVLSMDLNGLYHRFVHTGTVHPGHAPIPSCTTPPPPRHPIHPKRVKMEQYSAFDHIMSVATPESRAPQPINRSIGGGPSLPSHREREMLDIIESYNKLIQQLGASAPQQPPGGGVDRLHRGTKVAHVLPKGHWLHTLPVTQVLIYLNLQLRAIMRECDTSHSIDWGDLPDPMHQCAQVKHYEHLLECRKQLMYMTASAYEGEGGTRGYTEICKRVVTLASTAYAPLPAHETPLVAQPSSPPPTRAPAPPPTTPHTTSAHSPLMYITRNHRQAHMKELMAIWSAFQVSRHDHVTVAPGVSEQIRTLCDASDDQRDTNGASGQNAMIGGAYGVHSIINAMHALRVTGVHAKHALTIRVALCPDLRDRPVITDLWTRVLRIHGKYWSTWQRRLRHFEVNITPGNVKYMHPYYEMLRILTHVGYTYSVDEWCLLFELVPVQALCDSETCYRFCCRANNNTFVSLRKTCPYDCVTTRYRSALVSLDQCPPLGDATSGSIGDHLQQPPPRVTVFIPAISRRVSPLEYIGARVTTTEEVID